VVKGIQPGDKLLRIDGRDLQGESLAATVDAFRGKPGTRHKLVVERKGKQLLFNVLIVRLL
jgi:carboxyl-terminal processing protease